MKFKPMEERFRHHAHIVVRTANVLDLVQKYDAQAKRNVEDEGEHQNSTYFLVSIRK